jgi:hypothetical protein
MEAKKSEENLRWYSLSFPNESSFEDFLKEFNNIALEVIEAKGDNAVYLPAKRSKKDYSKVYLSVSHEMQDKFEIKIWYLKGRLLSEKPAINLSKYYADEDCYHRGVDERVNFS